MLAPTDSKKKSSRSGSPAMPRWVARGPAQRPAEGMGARRRASRAPARSTCCCPAPTAALAGVVLGLGAARAGDPMDRAELARGAAARRCCRPGSITWPSGVEDRRLAAVAWGLGAYRFRRYKSRQRRGGWPSSSCRAAPTCERALATVDGVWLGRDLINTPASDLGPQELEEAARQLAKRHGAKRQQHRRRRSARPRTSR